MEADYEIVSRGSDGANVVLRGVAANDPPEGAEIVQTPTLEEAYLAFMAARGRSEAARQVDDEQTQ